jgi:hypothetical protein
MKLVSREVSKVQTWSTAVHERSEKAQSQSMIRIPVLLNGGAAGYSVDWPLETHSPIPIESSSPAPAWRGCPQGFFPMLQDDVKGVYGARCSRTMEKTGRKENRKKKRRKKKKKEEKTNPLRKPFTSWKKHEKVSSLKRSGYCPKQEPALLLLASLMAPGCPIECQQNTLWAQHVRRTEYSRVGGCKVR